MQLSFMRNVKQAALRVLLYSVLLKKVRYLDLIDPWSYEGILVNQLVLFGSDETFGMKFVMFTVLRLIYRKAG